MQREVSVDADYPITKCCDDRLGRTHLALHVADMLRTAPSAHSIVFGLSGSWGSGKTSVLNMVRELLGKDDDPPVIVRFNPWNYPAGTDLVRPFLNLLASEIRKARSGEAAKKLAEDAVGVIGEYANALEPLILKAKELGLAVKIDTNGTLPDKLEALINREEIRPDMIAMDIKTKPRNYYLLCPGYSGCIPDTDATAGKIERSISILAKAAAEKLIEVEYRTVLVPGLTEEEDIEAISLLLPHDAEWKFAAFSPGGCINPEWDNIQPFSREKTDKLLEIARRNVPAASLR